MLQRPKAGETEEDLLQQEEEFLKQSGKAPTQKRNLEAKQDEGNSPSVSGIVGEVVERKQGLPSTSDHGIEAKLNGFPAPFQIDPQLMTGKKGKKSLFAEHMEKNKKAGPSLTIVKGEEISFLPEHIEKSNKGGPALTIVKGEEISFLPEHIEKSNKGGPALTIVKIGKKSLSAEDMEKKKKTGPALTIVKIGKKSLSAEDMEKKKNVGGNTTVKIDTPNLSTGEAGPTPGPSMKEEDTENACARMESLILSDVKKSIHEENSKKLSAMSEAEIVEAQKTLHETLDPKLISLVKTRSKSKKKPQPATVKKTDGAALLKIEMPVTVEKTDGAEMPATVEKTDGAALLKIEVPATDEKTDGAEMPKIEVPATDEKTDGAEMPKIEVPATDEKTDGAEMPKIEVPATDEKTDGAEMPKIEVPATDEKTDSAKLPKMKTVKETVRSYVGDKWLNMDILEKEKLEWVGDIPRADALQPGQSYSARFNFKGELQPYTAEIDVTSALYHHGDEPERPGYTIQELYQLSRSSVLQQRRLALRALGNIIYKAKLGYYDYCFDGYLLHKLIEADLFLLLRFSIDHNSVIGSSIYCLRRLIYNDSDEYCQDRLLGTTEDDLQPLLFERFDEDGVDEKELTDDTIIHRDLIRGMTRTDLLTRMTYILNHLPCDRKTITNAVMCFIRVARHSPDSCDRLGRTPDLLHFLYTIINCNDPIYQAVKLLRLLTGQSKLVVARIVSDYPSDFFIQFLNQESSSEISNQEFCLLKLECIYLWKNFIRCGFMKDDFTNSAPCLVRMLHFFVERLDLYAESDFDFELFTALMSLLRLCIRVKLPIDNNYVAQMYVCTEKWMKQLIESQKFNYSSMKALGSCFGFFIDYFGIFGCREKDLPFVRKLNRMISTLIGSPCFDVMATRLTDYSHLLVTTPVERDPSNLPSLCSVYENGEDFLRIVNNKSTFPFFLTFTKYLEFSYEVFTESENNVRLFVNHPAIRKYVTEVMKLEKNWSNWFERYELTLLTDILQLFCTVKDNQTMKFGFRLFPMIRVDDEEMVTVTCILTESKIWDSKEEFFEFLPDIYLDTLGRHEVRRGYALRYRCETAGEDWIYKVLTKIRARDVPEYVTKILKFLTLVNEREPDLLERIPYTVRYYHLCSVFLNDSNVFTKSIQTEMRSNFRFILENREKVDLSMKVDRKKSFYDLYTELITQYAAVSYCLPIFAEFVLFPLQNRFDISYRKLIWFEYIHVLKVITVPYPSPEFIDIKEFVEPYETDESLLVAYLNSVSSNVISKERNPFVYNLAISNINNYMRNASSDSTLFNFLSRRIKFTISDDIKQDLTSS